MKRILLACFLLTATCTVVSTQHATAQTTPPPVTQTSFMAKVTAMDTYIGAGNMTMAQSTWTEVHNMMLAVLATSKTSIGAAGSPAAQAPFITILTNQRAIYWDVWALKTDLATNRAAINTKLSAFSATIY